MLVKLAILAAAALAGIAVSVRVWRLRRTPQPLDQASPGPVPGPTDIGLP